MKTVKSIDPNFEYENVKGILGSLNFDAHEKEKVNSLTNSVDRLKLAINILMEREDIRRGKRFDHPPKTNIDPKNPNKSKKEREDYTKLPSVRFPNLEIKEIIVSANSLPKCTCCDSSMRESGLFDTIEKLQVIPKQIYITREKRIKYNCGKCHGSIVNTPPTPSIIPGSNYGDSFILDVALSKYCDLIPIERYCMIAGREGVANLPANSAIGLTHHLANFLNVVYLKIKSEVQNSLIGFGDETTHRMLEGDITKNWRLWGFFCKSACFFEARDTRSGEVAYEFLKNTSFEYFLSDAYVGYTSAINKLKEEGKIIIEVNCNSHAVVYFKKAAITWKDEAAFYLESYKEIYELEEKVNDQKTSDHERIEYRKEMLPIFEKIKVAAERDILVAMPESAFKTALRYFLNNYKKLTICTENFHIPLDNNLAERSFRSYVVGRKTWIGTHSKRGALTAAILYTIVETCKLVKVNPRNYFPWVVQQILNNSEILTPSEYLKKAN